jgi:probable HAF family extracellular repeat protein
MRIELVLGATLLCGIAVAQSHTHSLPAAERLATPAARYSAVDLGAFQAREADERPGLSTRGKVAAWEVVEQTQVRATLMVPGGIRRIAASEPSMNSFAFAINDDGQAAGIFESQQDLRNSRGFWFDGSVVHELPALGGQYSAARGMAHGGTVVGNAETSTGQIHATVWRNGRATDLGVLRGGDLSRAFAINAHGQAAGEANATVNGKVTAVIWNEHGIRPLGLLPGGSYSSVQALNDLAMAVGYADDASGKAQAVLFEHDQITVLGSLGDDPSTALDVNDQRQIVGSSSVHMGLMHVRAFLWESGHMLQLDQLIEPPGSWQLLSAFRINAAGQILAFGFFQGRTHLCLLSPKAQSPGKVGSSISYKHSP